MAVNHDFTLNCFTVIIAVEHRITQVCRSVEPTFRTQPRDRIVKPRDINQNSNFNITDCI